MDLICQISKGDKPTQIKWNFVGLFENQGLRIRTNRISEKSSMLSVPSASAFHTGQYTCTATNAAGSVSHSIDIVVNGIKSNICIYL